MADVKTALDLFGDLRGKFVIVTFADGHEESGLLSKVGWDLIEVDHIDTVGGGMWTATYTMTGDADTPHVVGVVEDMPQQEALFA